LEGRGCFRWGVEGFGAVRQLWMGRVWKDELKVWHSSKYCHGEAVMDRGVKEGVGEVRQ